MNFYFERLIKTGSSEQYNVYNDDREDLALVNIHYSEEVNIFTLLLIDEEEANEEFLYMLMREIERRIISSHSSYEIELYHTFSIGKITAGYPNKINIG